MVAAMMDIKKKHKESMLIAKFQEKASSIYNHPLLKFYIEKQVNERKEQIEFERYKKRMFQLVKWQHLKNIKQEQ
mgnify:CR=1 FL=1